MAKVQNLLGIQQTIAFTEFDFYDLYKETFMASELGRIRSLLPLREMAISFGLIERNPKSLRVKKGRKPYFSPEGQMALMFLKHYTGLSAPKLMEELNGNIHYQIFCGIRINPMNPLKNYKLIDDIALNLSKNLRLQEQQVSLAALASFDGVVWLKHDFVVADNDANSKAILSLGKIDDNDITWINGVKIGETRGAGVDRVYSIPSGILKKGKNSIVIKVIDVIREGGLTGKSDDLFIEIADGKYNLAGEWQYKKSIETNGISYEEFTPNLYYGLLYNAMIDPLKDFAMKGVIWYQGENNAGQAFDYRTLFPTLINDWRSKWGYEFPFYWVQLASYMQKTETPPETDNWAELREAQTLTLSVNNTGQAITTDIGDANDIHPKNKQDVGKRLAAIALNKDYGRKDIVYSGPTFKNAIKNNDRIIVSFDQIALGLHVANKYGYIEGFAIAGADQKFVWAKAYLDDKDRVVVYSEKVKDPVAVRYCWSINPDVNLFNSAGLPASPFRTDNWKISSEN